MRFHRIGYSTAAKGCSSRGSLDGALHNLLEFYLNSGHLRWTSNIMRIELFHASDLERVLRRRKIATMPELKEALGTDVDVTVFRKLKHLAYRSSYSHRGSYYVLDETAQFDERGLWSCNSIWFSRYGTLLETAASLVAGSEAGYFTEELDDLLHVETKGPLLKLVQQKRVARELVDGTYLYCSKASTARELQLRKRRKIENEPGVAGGLSQTEAVPEELKAAIILFFSMLDEKQRRLYAGLESLKLGHGGDQRIAAFIGMDPHTVANGRQELIEQDFQIDRIRRAGGGRKRVEKKRPKSSRASKS